jgi:ubiquinone biosynthesis monooxygenase Coq7
MRVNHSGEVCAQALYHGQALSARSSTTRQHMQLAAQEETDHLAWCQTRIKELGSHTSYLNPFWYFQSFSIGVLAGLAGDRWSLGFVRETERQVTAHIDKHLQRLPPADTASHAILMQMRADEQQHAHQAEQAGAAELPWIIRQTMRLTAKVMTTTAYWI